MITKRKLIAYSAVLLCTLLVGCENSDNNSSENTQDSLSSIPVATSANVSEKSTSAKSTNTPQNSESVQTLNENHVNQILSLIDMSCTTASNVSASFFKKAVDNALDENSDTNYDGVYENYLPTGLESYINNYFDCTGFEQYCIKINKGTVSVWVSIEMNKEELAEQFDDELWSDLGYTDVEALFEALDRIDKIHYGMAPDKTYSIYQDSASLPDNPCYSNKKPQLT